MALIKCPECGSSISDKAEKCPHCGLPATYFMQRQTQTDVNYDNLANILVSFDSDYSRLFSKNHYITHRDEKYLQETYGAYYRNLKNKMIFQYIENHAGQFRLDIDMLKSFIRKMHTLDADLSAHNNAYVDSIVTREKEYFDHILFDIDPAIKLDDEQRRAVVTDDDYCLLVAGAGAGKTTTMAAKVKYLVEKQHINPEEIIVISYTRKAIGELKERINDGLHIPAEICTFHKFAYDIVKRFSSEPPEVNFSSYDIIFDMLEHAVFHDKALMRNLVLFLGYYFDLTEDVFKFDNLEQYHLYKASQDYETLKSGLGEYVKKVEQQRFKRTKTITGEYLRSVQEVQIANFLYLNGLDYEYERVYPFDSPSRGKKYTPDFYITQGEHTAWLEHYALTESGYNRIFTPKQIAKYKKGIRDKRALHASYRTALLETWSIYNDRRSLLDHLKETLEKEGFVLKPRNLDEVYKKIVETGKDKYIYKLIFFMMDFIEQYKTTGYDAGGFEILRKKTDNPRTLLFLDIAEQVYHHYQKTLKQRNQIDFADMINDAHAYLQEIEQQGIELPYKYIIIDEFQDIARQRFNLTKRLSEINMFEGKFGFPCQIEDDPIMKLVTYEDTSMPYAEERRLFYVAMTRTKNRVYIMTPQHRPSRFLIELIKDYKLPHSEKLNMQVVDLFNLRCPICGFPLKYEFNKNYGLNLWICTNEVEVCDFMTNDKIHKHDIKKCDKCKDGYLIVRVNPKDGDVFYGCTNYHDPDVKCKRMIPLSNDPI